MFSLAADDLHFATGGTRRWFVGLVCLLLSSGCGGRKDDRSLVVRAEAASEQWIAQWKSEDWQSVQAFYAPEFQQVTPPAAWQEHLRQVRADAGAYHRHSVVARSVQQLADRRCVVLSYALEHDHGTVKHTFTWAFNEAGCQLIGHKIDVSMLKSDP